MKGLEILSQAEVATDYGFNWKVFLITLAVIGVIGFIISFIVLQDTHWSVIAITMGLVLVLGTLLGMMTGYSAEIPVSYETQYKVTISDEVKMNEFFEQYEIIDQEGKIYTIRKTEKE